MHTPRPNQVNYARTKHYRAESTISDPNKTVQITGSHWSWWGSTAKSISTHPTQSRFPQHEIDDPATADVNLLRIAAMVQHVVVVAARILERIREDRHRAEVA